MARIATEANQRVHLAQDNRARRTSAARVSAARTWALWRRLLPASLALGGFYLVLLFWRLIHPGQPTPLVLLAGTSATLLFGCALALGRRRITIGATHRCAAWLAGVVWLNSLAQLALLGDPRDILGLVLLLLGTGLLFTSARWLVLIIGATLSGWLLLAWALASSPVWPQAGQTLLCAALLAGLLFARRMRALEHQEHRR